MVRPRINALLADMIKNSVITVCAGAGYGKTHAVSDFIRHQGIPAMWIQLNERDNICVRFWDDFTGTIEHLDKLLADECRSLGFPDTADKLNRFVSLMHHSLADKRFLFVIDDFHLAREPSVILFIERIIHELPPDGTLILICRDLPKINIRTIQIKGLIPDMLEKDLSFTENELTEYLKQQGLNVSRHITREILQDTGGWAFAVNLVARSLKRAPGYSGYVKNALKQNVFKLMEMEGETVSELLKRFLVRLSLVDHLSADFVNILARGDSDLLTELKQWNTYIRFDSYGDTYLIHPLLLELLRTKQDILTEEEKRDTYKAAADWCNQNNFKIDALGYYEKVWDYKSIISILLEGLGHTSYDLACYAIGIFERASAEVFDCVDFFAAMHLYILLCLSRWQDFITLATRYEKRLLMLPEDDILRNHTLGGIYYFWGNLRFLMGAIDGRCDFDMYHIKMADCFIKSPTELTKTINLPLGSWVSAVGSARVGAPQEYADNAARVVKHISNSINITMGLDDLYLGELKFYQGDIQAAEKYILRAFNHARKNKQYDFAHRALFYIMRIAVFQGNFAKAEQALKEMEEGLDIKEYSARFITYDIALGWYHCILRQPERVPDWLKGEFAPYGHAYFIENFGNQIKARYYYLANNHLPLLSYIEDMKQRESILYGRVEMLAMEACVHFQMKNKEEAFNILREAYETAVPNDIIMPFIELSKDMRTLTMAALREPEFGISYSWLEAVRRKASSYGKYQSLLMSEFKNANGMEDYKDLSHRENEILHDLYQGMSRSEIAHNRNLSMGTVNTVINNIYKKLNVQSIADIIRIVSEQKQM